MDAAGNQIVPRPLRRRLAQHGRLDLQKALFREELAGQRHDLALHHEISLDIRPSQVKITVFQTHFFSCLAVLFHLERRRQRLGEDAHFLWQHLDLTRCDLVIDRAGTSRHFADDGNHIFGAEGRGFLKDRRVGLPFLAHHLDDAGAVAHIHEDQSAFISVLLHPSHDGYSLAHICRGQFAAAVGPL